MGKPMKNLPSIFASINVMQIVLVVSLVVGSFFLGSLWTKVQILEKGGVAPAAAQPAAQQQPTPPPAVTQDQIKKAYDGAFLRWGDKNKKLVFVEIADPSCPYCHIAAGKNPQLNAQAGDRFKLVSDGGTYKPPVPEIEKLVKNNQASLVYLYTPGHGNGEMGMKALYCAMEKNKFWEVHDLLYSSAGYDLLNNTVKNDKAKSGELATFLKAVIDSKFLKSCLDSGKYDKRLTDEVTLTRSLGVTGTPGFFVNTTLFAGAYSYTDMESAVKTALQ